MKILLAQFRRAAMLVMAVVLTGCIVSEEPLLDKRSGRSKPVKSGDYTSCPIRDGEVDGDCTQMKVIFGRDRQYRLEPKDEEPNFVRFRRMGRGDYLAQVTGGEPDGYIYFLATRISDGMEWRLLDCGEIPEELRAKMIARAELEEQEYGVCVVKKLRVAMKIARAFRDDPTLGGSERVRFTRAKATN